MRILDFVSRKFGLRIWRQPHTTRIGYRLHPYKATR